MSNNQEYSIFELRSQPGIRRDGTEFDDPYYTDGEWVRWQRRRVRKIGGYAAISQLVSGPVRGVHVDSRSGLVRAHLMSERSIEQLTFDNNGFGSGLVDRTPVGFSPNELYTWQADSMYESSGAGAPRLVCACAPDLLALDSDSTGYIYSGDITGAGSLSAVSEATGYVRVSGGICVLQPFLFAFGSNGLIRNSNANDFSSTTGWSGTNANTANVAGTKIVKGLPIRGGSSNSPAGLFWALDSLIRVSYVGGTALWSYDTVSAHTTILAKNAPIEYDGLYYWVGVDRFYVYSGVVQELPNEMNLNWFFDNINMAYRNKVWALKVPRYGEIWWLFPFGDSTECNAAVIYNVREKTWYDTRVTRSAGFQARTFVSPVMAGGDEGTNTTLLRYTAVSGEFSVGDRVTGGTSTAYGDVVRVGTNRLNLDNVVGVFSNGETISSTAASGTLTEAPVDQELSVVWRHEYGTDKILGQTTTAIQAYYETRNFTLLDGTPATDGAERGTNLQARIVRLEPDFVLTGNLELTVRGRAFPNAEKVDSERFTITPETLYVPLKEQRRSMSLRFESNAAGGDFQEGRNLITVGPGDERG